MATIFFFFFNDTAPPEIYPLPLHDALPISSPAPPIAMPETMRFFPRPGAAVRKNPCPARRAEAGFFRTDRKSTRLNSSHTVISYAVFCLKKKKQRSQARQVHRKPPQALHDQ